MSEGGDRGVGAGKGGFETWAEITEHLTVWLQVRAKGPDATLAVGAESKDVKT